MCAFQSVTTRKIQHGTTPTFTTRRFQEVQKLKIKNTLQENLQPRINELKEKFQEIKTEYTEKITLLLQRIQSMEDEIKASTGCDCNTEEIEQNIQTLQSEMNNKLNKTFDEKQTIAWTTANFTPAYNITETNDVNEFLIGLRDYVETLCGNVMHNDSQIGTINTKIDQLNSCACAASDVTNRLTTNEEAITNLSKKIGDLETEIGEHNEENDTNENDIKSKLASLQSSVNGIKLTISENKTNLQSQINTINENATNLQSQIKTNEDNISSLESRIVDLETAKLQNDYNLQAKQEQIDTNRNDIETLQEQIKEVQNNVNFDAYTQTISVPAGSVYTMKQINSDGTVGEITFHTIADAINSLESSIINFWNRF